MRFIRLIFAALFIAALPLPAFAQVFVSVSIGAPPPIPVYQQPPVPGYNDIWQPGYWAWAPDAGYYWVPGTWVVAPEVGYLWTPGYWSFGGNGYRWNQGYWGPQVGFYGGVNYGGGYDGNNFVGGRWHGRSFQYNSYVTNVNSRYARNVYVDRNVNRSVNRVSYNGGRGGIMARPNAQQLAIARGPHVPMTSVQRQHAQLAVHNHALYASANQGRPAQAAVAHPYAATNRPAMAANHAPAAHAAAAYHAPAAAYHAPAAAYHAPAAAYHAPAAAYHAPAPAYHPQAAPQMHAAPVAHAAPAQHAAGNRDEHH